MTETVSLCSFLIVIVEKEFQCKFSWRSAGRVFWGATCKSCKIQSLSPALQYQLWQCGILGLMKSGLSITCLLLPCLSSIRKLKINSFEWDVVSHVFYYLACRLSGNWNQFFWVGCKIHHFCLPIYISEAR